MKIETVKSMTEQYLKDNGYDGLTCEDCCCHVDKDLFRCGDGYDGVLSCLAGVEHPTLKGMITLKSLRAKS